MSLDPDPTYQAARPTGIPPYYERTGVRPLITLLLVCYNQERYIKQAIEGAFSQTYSPLEVVISDDASIDHTYDIVCECVRAYKGPHAVIVNRNAANLGICGNLNKAMEMSSGMLIVVAAGDDISYSNRVQVLYSYWEAHRRCFFSIFTSADYIRQDGAQCGEHRVSTMAIDSPVKLAPIGVPGPAATQAWRREVFDVFGPIDPSVVSEDVVIPFRASLLGTVGLLDEKTVAYRVGVGFSSTSSLEKLFQYRNALTQHRRDITLVGVEDDVLDNALAAVDTRYDMHIALYDGKILYPILLGIRGKLGLWRSLVLVSKFLVYRLPMIPQLRKVSRRLVGKV